METQNGITGGVLAAVVGGVLLFIAYSRDELGDIIKKGLAADEHNCAYCAERISLIPRSSTCSLRLTHQVAQEGHSAESRKSRTGDRTESDAASSSIDWAACSAVSRAR